ncbi:MAG: winged helix-turn-helix transcriptional regulator [Gemmatimonadota bacterium]|nr:MAG: winged helix-turn-helix transcriptional regulator [Gemmatimonadota bacterium]
MKQPRPKKLARAVARYRALGDETRLRILHLLVGGEVCVCDLAAQLDITQPLLSFHLKTLRDADLVRARRDGRWTHYSVDPGALEELGGSLSALVREHRKRSTLAVKCC